MTSAWRGSCIALLEVIQILAELGANFRVTLAQRNGCLQVTDLGTAVITNTIIAIGQNLLFAQKAGNAIRQLNFTTGTRFDIFQVMKDTAR